MANPYTDEVIFRWDPLKQSLLVLHPDPAAWTGPIAEIGEETLAAMSWPEASRFIGEFVTLLVPALRTRYGHPVED